MKALCLTAIVLSTLAIGLSTYALLQTDARIEQALIRREKAAVELVSPQFQKIFDDFELEVSEASRNPQQMKDLWMPLVELIERLSE